MPRLGHGFAQRLQPGSAAAQSFCGLCCLLALLLTAPNLVGGALLGALAGLLTAQRRGYERADRQAGLYSYNGVLIGILIAALLPWSAIVPPLIIAAGGLSSILTHQWRKRGGKLLVAYTAPFVLLGWGTLLMTEPMPALFTEANPLYALLRGVGQIFLLGNPLAGLLIVIGMLVANPTPRSGLCWDRPSAVVSLCWQAKPRRPGWGCTASTLRSPRWPSAVRASASG